MKIAPLLLLLSFSLPVQGVVFVFGDAFATDGSGDFSAPSTGSTGNAGNVIDSVYSFNIQDSSTIFGNPFNSGNPGGNFSPLVVGDIFGTDYRSTLSFDISGIAVAPAGLEYVVTSVELFLEVSSVDEVDGASVDVDVYTNQGVTGAALSNPDTTFNVANDSGLNGNFLPAINLSTGSVDLNNPSDFLITLDIADANDGIRFGSSLSTAAAPNQGINGTNFVQVAPRLVINADLVAIPEPSSLGFLSLFGMIGITYRKRK